MAKGDKIRVTYQLGDGISTIEVVADKAGRSVDFENDPKKNQLKLEVLGRAGSSVRTVTMRLDTVILMEEIPA